MNAKEVRLRLHALANPEHAKTLSWFFKTGPGEYGEGDVFVGVKVPALRKLAKEFAALSLAASQSLLQSQFHEERLLALLILVLQAAGADAKGRKEIYDLYLANMPRVNNWDLVDLSAPQLVGTYLQDRSRRALYRHARSKSLWERRISIVATFPFIREHDFADTLSIAEILLGDREDLIHKAVGWMLREVGKRDLAALEGFLCLHRQSMPRTMLRYAIERFEEEKRQAYLKR